MKKKIWLTSTKNFKVNFMINSLKIDKNPYDPETMTLTFGVYSWCVWNA